MSHTNETQYYGLPQYIGTDIINPLTDTNEAYEAIDTALHNVATNSQSAVETANTANTHVETINGRVVVTEQDVAQLKVGQSNLYNCMAQPFDETGATTYHVGDFVQYQGALYEFIVDHTGVWNGNDVSSITVGEMMSKLLAMVAQPFSTTKTYQKDEFCTRDNKLYRFNKTHIGAWNANDVIESVVADLITEVIGMINLIDPYEPKTVFGEYITYKYTTEPASLVAAFTSMITYIRGLYTNKANDVYDIVIDGYKRVDGGDVMENIPMQVSCRETNNLSAGSILIRDSQCYYDDGDHTHGNLHIVNVDVNNAGTGADYCACSYQYGDAAGAISADDGTTSIGTGGDHYVTYHYVYDITVPDEPEP